MKLFRVATVALSAAALGATVITVAGARTAPPPRRGLPNRAATPRIYAVNQYGVSVTAFQQTASGNIAPTVDISGSQTRIYQPEGFAVASNGTVAVSDSQAGETPDVIEFAPGANGNAAPSASLTCGGVGGSGVPNEVAFDEQGNLYVQYFEGHKAPSDAIEVYTPQQQSGCVITQHILFGSQTGITAFGGLAVLRGTIYTAYVNEVQEFHTWDNGNVAPFNVIEGPSTGLDDANGVAVDRQGYVYVANGSDVVVFAPGAGGSAKPIAVISGSNTLIPAQGYGAISIGVGNDGTIFVGVQYDTDASSILVFPPGSNGNIAPERVITGESTGLDWVSEMGILQ